MTLTEFRVQLEFLAHTHEKLESLINGIPDSSAHLRHSPEEFSATEHICHLRDIELEGYAPRIQRMLAENHPVLPDIDGARLAIERNYNQQDIHDALLCFAKVRRRNIETLMAQDATQLEREGELEGVGTIKLRELVSMLREHDEAHLEELEAWRHRANSINN